jgi:hypothetical protein
MHAPHKLKALSMCVGLNRRGQEKTLSFSLVWWRVGENLFRIVSEGCVPAEGCGGEGQFAAPHCIASVCKITDKRQLGSDLLMAFELIPAASAHPLLWLQDPHAADHSQKLFPGARLLFALDLIYGCTAHTHSYRHNSLALPGPCVRLQRADQRKT